LVDANGGSGHPATLLSSYKALREARACQEMKGVTTPVGWIESIQILCCNLKIPRPRALIRPRQKLNLAKVTLLLGNNEVGKTGICEWLAGATDPSALDRWQGSDLDYSVRLYSPEEHLVRVRIQASLATYELDGKSCAFNPLPIQAHWLSTPWGDGSGSDIEFLADFLRDTAIGIKRLIEHYRQKREERVADLWIEDIWVEDPGRVMVKASWEQTVYSLKELSHSGRGLVALTLAILRATTAAWHAPTLLLVEDLFARFDSARTASALQMLGGADRRFQTLITSPEHGPKIEWYGWAVKRLLPSDEGAELAEL
jgi:hypothetical protein